MSCRPPSARRTLFGHREFDTAKIQTFSDMEVKNGGRGIIAVADYSTTSLWRDSPVGWLRSRKYTPLDRSFKSILWA